MGISGRLRYIASLVSPGNSCADIGTDHGFVPAYLVRENISPRVIAVDLSEGSLEKARNLSEKLGIEDRMECRISDGLENIAGGEVDTVIISGMGGILMTDILGRDLAKLESVKELVLSPHRDAALVRDFLSDHGFSVIRDEEIKDRGKTYTVIKAVREP